MLVEELTEKWDRGRSRRYVSLFSVYYLNYYITLILRRQHKFVLLPAKFHAFAFDHFQRQAAAQLSQYCLGQHLKGKRKTRLVLVTGAWEKFVKLTTVNKDELIVKHRSMHKDAEMLLKF